MNGPPAATEVAATVLTDAVREWYDANQRALPWRSGDRTPWGVLTSEIMLQQTPVARVLPVWTAWMERWPTPATLAAASTEDVLRAWGRLGYPRRALNLHHAAIAVMDRHGGVLPDDEATLRMLPGIGEYTAAAISSFAYGKRAVVLDTNVRRVIARAVAGAEFPQPSLNNTERDRARSLVPEDTADAAHWAIAVMELGALICTARAPSCEACPIANLCAWRAAGSPPYDGPTRRTQKFEGTDRQIRGRLMSVLREGTGPVDGLALTAAWPDGPRRDQCLAGLIDEGLVDLTEGGMYRLGSGA
ncbi:A/G-specific adenine glycosylase [Nocardioides jejuensis]|uniref:Adenine DNA glycosylase n=2 Tax=Nocardioides jejuensis TaxID=2502782 RepID=A0A4V2NXL1_9ACTN|nr:A/G-specific adenine glycosylase [Nocardioides jejuensis]TCJ21672.1 A/G-specific adenine glycosylase [Nocardioides jejuensis]